MGPARPDLQTAADTARHDTALSPAYLLPDHNGLSYEESVSSVSLLQSYESLSVFCTGDQVLVSSVMRYLSSTG